MGIHQISAFAKEFLEELAGGLSYPKPSLEKTRRSGRNCICQISAFHQEFIEGMACPKPQPSVNSLRWSGTNLRFQPPLKSVGRSGMNDRACAVSGTYG